jgi:type I restriction enzyme R subunit
VLEAKADTAPLSEGVGQAKDYAEKLQIRFAYSSNGKGVYAIDMTSGEEGEAAGFPSPQELWDRTFAEENAWRDRFAAIHYPDKGGSWQIRFYQDIAVSRVLEAIASGSDRILLTLATGRGKTSIAFQIIWKLFQARWNLSGQPRRRPRVLFLADRNNLADQAFNDFTAFAAFEDNALARIAPDDLRKKGRVPTNASVFLTIFQTFMSGSDVDGMPSPWFGQYPVTSKQELFLNFVLQHYVSTGVQELAIEKLTPLLQLRYQNSIADAVTDLGPPAEIGKVFAGFQKYLYEPQGGARVFP